MIRHLSRIASLFFVLFAGVAGAATPLLIPVESASVGVKTTTDAPVRFNREGLEPLVPGAPVELTLPNGSRHDYIFESSVSHGGGFTTWVARSPLTGDNERAVITYGPNGAWGWMRTTYGDYRIYPSGQGYDLVAKREPVGYGPKKGGSDVVRVGPDDPQTALLTGTPTIVDTLPVASMLAKGLKDAPSPTLQSDVMLLYTKDLAGKLGVGLMPMLYNIIATLNQAYIDSEVAITLRLVNATMIDYPNGEDPSDNGSTKTLSAMAGSGANAPFFQGLTWGGASSLRNIVGADFVALLRDGPTDTGGIGNLPMNPVTYPVSTVTQSTAYSVNNSCASGCEGIVAHEVGHNMGNHHDQATVAKDSGTGMVDETGVFPYSFGYYSCANGLTCNPFLAGGCPSGYASCAGPSNINDFGTVMSYFGPKIMKFSNPLLSNCFPAGGNPLAPRICGGAEPAPPAPAPATSTNNALSMNNVRGALSAFRAQTIVSLPGSVQFTNTGYSGAEGGNLTFTVSRASGSSGAISVNYSVAAGTATAGADFTATSGTLTWATGDGADKTFSVAIAADAIVEGVETITATLSNPTGATGVYLGYPTTATGLILEPWPVGTLGGIPTDPPGWSSPATASPSNSPWAIVSDSAPAGDPGGTSLKSGAIDFAVAKRLCSDPSYGAIPCPSIIDLGPRTFAAGTVAYAYRVSAFPGNGFLEFLVDGVVVQSASGVSTNTAADTGWQFFSTTITAGTHTLRWQYRPRFSFPCALAISSGGSTAAYPGCLDRAWIDQLALPSNSAVGGTFALTVTKAGTGAGTVTSSPAGVSCGATCAATFTSGAVVSLTAAASAGSTFTGWSGSGCSGTGGCSVTMSAASAVTATFTPLLGSTTTLVSGTNPSNVGQSVTFTATVSGSGGTPTGTVAFNDGVTAICTAVAMTSGQAQCATSALLAGSRSITAAYSGNPTYLASTSSTLTQVVNVPAGTQALAVVRAGTGTGTVTSSPAGISCGPTCAAAFTAGASVTLTATPAAGSTFSGWSRAGCSGTGTCTVTMAAASSVTATFVNFTGTLRTRYRLYSPGTLEHLYTTDFNEYSVLPVCCAWIAEGAIYQLFVGAGSYGGVAAVPYYRLYNPFSFQHHWTTDLGEYNFLPSVGWIQEGVDGRILPTQPLGTLPLYRLYLNAAGGLHLWTIDANERNFLVANAGWVDEGIAGYVVPLP